MTSMRLLAGAFTRFYSVIFSFPCSTLSGYVLRRSPLRDIARISNLIQTSRPSGGLQRLYS